MNNFISVPCHIEGCTQFYEYLHDELKPKALCALWDIPDGNMDFIPIVSKNYTVKILGAIKLNPEESFWLMYQHPFSIIDGIENDKQIESFRLCLCKFEKVLEIGIKSLRMNIEVLKVLTLEEASQSVEASNNYLADFDININDSYRNFRKIGNYSLLEFSYQGDVGKTFIISNKNSVPRALALYYWDFHEESWEILNHTLKSEIR